MYRASVIVWPLLAVALLAGCSKKECFSVYGNISGAEGEMLYLDHIGVSETHPIDSVRLRADGKFRFCEPRNPYPELYRLRTDSKGLIVAIDSTEQVEITATVDSLPYDAHIDGSESTRQITELRKSLQADSRDEHKRLAGERILKDPRSIVAYYALLQHKDGQFVFNLADKNDRLYFSAVATAWHAFMPDAERTRKLYSIVDEKIRDERRNEQMQTLQAFIEESDNAFLDITLPDEYGKEQSLSALRGKVILLDFSAVAMPQSNAYIFELRDLYNQYHTQGFEIYQVSADDDTDLWTASARNLPWVTVHSDENSRQCYRTYNVHTIPTLFLINRKGEVVGRNISFDQLPKHIEECLH